ncbi:hypothetical protein PR048_017166 [Dryococelus australis]|uniref:Uncharacterized protein n=1 Tax=Dryococelus australis TaxID=614101 RepID=A0ABQ9H8S0_9NEOP|nr:hypothetical protein PR048_017166 [Dryococelus australis]
MRRATHQRLGRLTKHRPASQLPRHAAQELIEAVRVQVNVISLIDIANSSLELYNDMEQGSLQTVRNHYTREQMFRALYGRVRSYDLELERPMIQTITLRGTVVFKPLPGDTIWVTSTEGGLYSLPEAATLAHELRLCSVRQPENLNSATCNDRWAQIPIHSALQTLFHSTKPFLCVIGAEVAEQLDRSPPTKANRVRSPAGSLRIFASGDRAGRCRWSADFLGNLRFPPPLDSSAAPYLTRPSSALKASLLRTIQISSLTLKEWGLVGSTIPSSVLFLVRTCSALTCLPTGDPTMRAKLKLPGLYLGLAVGCSNMITIANYLRQRFLYGTLHYLETAPKSPNYIRYRTVVRASKRRGHRWTGLDSTLTESNTCPGHIASSLEVGVPQLLAFPNNGEITKCVTPLTLSSPTKLLTFTSARRKQVSDWLPPAGGERSIARRGDLRKRNSHVLVTYEERNGRQKQVTAVGGSERAQRLLGRANTRPIKKLLHDVTCQERRRGNGSDIDVHLWTTGRRLRSEVLGNGYICVEFGARRWNSYLYNQLPPNAPASRVLNQSALRNLDSSWQPSRQGIFRTEPVGFDRALNIEVLTPEENEVMGVWGGAGMQERGKRRFPRKPADQSGTIPTCENPGTTPPGIESGSLRWEASSRTATRLRLRTKGANVHAEKTRRKVGATQKHGCTTALIMGSVTTPQHIRICPALLGMCFEHIITVIGFLATPSCTLLIHHRVVHVPYTRDVGVVTAASHFLMVVALVHESAIKLSVKTPQQDMWALRGLCYGDHAKQTLHETDKSVFPLGEMLLSLLPAYGGNSKRLQESMCLGRLFGIDPLHDKELCSYRPLRKPHLDRHNRTQHVRWTSTYENYTREQWTRMLFTDEVRISLTSDDKQYPCLEGKLSAAAIGENITLMDDKSRVHRVNSVNRYLDDLASIVSRHELHGECTYMLLKTATANHPQSPQTLQDLLTAAMQEWDNLPLDVPDNLMLSILCRLQACLRVRGDQTHY